MAIRRECRFRGHVQGVGFRYATQRIAAHHCEVTGFVQNLDDGSVRLVIEGEAAELQAMLDEVRSQLRDYIRQVDDWRLPATGEFQGFDIRR